MQHNAQFIIALACLVLSRATSILEVEKENAKSHLVIRIGVNTSIAQQQGRRRHRISPYLVGLHQVYTNTPDSVFENDGGFSNWVKQSGVSTSRFPGGTVVKYWDWEDPTGQPWIDAKDPAFDERDNPPESTWMSLDEYLDFARRTGIAPILGVNSLHGTTYGVESEYIGKAARMVKHVKESGFGGAFWYIGNEEAHRHGGIADYAKVFSRYAKAMKAEDPNIRVFWNINNPSRRNIREFLANDGGTADGLETHGKWPFGGDPGLQPASFEEWQNEVPLRDRKNGNRATGGRVWRTAADQYRAWAKKAGRDLLIANNEYGFGKSKNMLGFDRYTMGLLMTEFLMEHFIGNWDASCFWDLARGTQNGLLDKQNGYRLNPFHLGMDLLADCQGGTYLQTVTADVPNVHGFAAYKDGKILVYLINKSGHSHSVQLSLSSGRIIQHASAQLMTNSSDSYGELQTLPMDSIDDERSILLPDLSFAEIVLFLRAPRQ